jgi:intracellular sulfur oxidation DsrE/DsrF family protein
MDRRNMLFRAAAALGAAFAVSRAEAATESPAQDKLKVVYHLSDLDKVPFVIGNIQNHLDGVGGPDHVTIAQANPDLSQHVGKLSKAGVGFAACGNTMKSQKIALNDLLPGFVVADKGGVVRIAELQAQGYLYLRP